MAHQPGEREPDVDYRIQEIADELMRMAQKLPHRISGESAFLELVAQILKRENQRVNSLKCAVGLYDRLFESVRENMESILKPAADVIEVPYQSDPAGSDSIESLGSA
jgi:hypothetical protein